MSVTASGPRSLLGHMLPSSTVDFSWFVAFKSIKIVRVKIDWNCNFVGLLHHPIWLKLDLALWSITFQLFELLCKAKDHWRGFSTRNAHMVHILIKSDLKWCIHLSRSLLSYSYMWHARRERFPYRTPGSVPRFGTCLCSNCCDKISRSSFVFTRVFTLNVPRYFLHFAYIYHIYSS